jgi:phosphoglycolate phosphatase
MTHDLVLFDLDGTISNPLEGIGRSLNFSLAHFGYETRELSELAQYVGPPLDDTFTALTGVSEDTAIVALVAKYRGRYAEVGYAENCLYPGVAEALASLSNTKMPMAVCTSKRQDLAEKILARLGLLPYFHFISGGEIGIHKTQQLQALVAQGLASRFSLMVGDRAVDVSAAHRNGLQAGGVLWGYGSQAELVAAKPRYLFHSPVELLHIQELIGEPGRSPSPAPITPRPPSGSGRSSTPRRCSGRFYR